MQKYQKIIELYRSRKESIEYFMEGVIHEFEIPDLKINSHSVIHSIKWRLKDENHLVDKLARKEREGRKITTTNLFQQITDFAGIRILHLYQDQFPKIHETIMNKVKQGDWILVENPIAYTWDPESTQFYKDLGIDTKVKDSFYTSIHYVVKPNNSSDICCEIQVRTLFEEIWGEIDHIVNYPHKTDCVACNEELRVLSKLVSTGTRLADSIFRNYDIYNSKKKPISKVKKDCAISIVAKKRLACDENTKTVDSSI